MIKLIVFDMDETLSPEDGCTEPECAERIRKISNNGIRIAVCSGKPTCYLSGYMRQFGIKNAIFGGENGCVIQFGTAFPPEYYEELKLDEEANSALAKIKSYITEKYPQIWLQQNTVALTCFVEDKAIADDISAFLERNSSEFSGIEHYRHWNSFDFVPKGINKSHALKIICDKLNITPLEVITVGNGINDYPMFEFSKYSVGILVPDKSRVTQNTESLSDALDYVENLIKKELK